MALFTTKSNFSKKKSINVFQFLAPDFMQKFKQMQWTDPEISVKDLILGLEMVYFALKRTFFEKHILAMFFYSEGLTLCNISNKSNKGSKDRCKWHNFGLEIA